MPLFLVGCIVWLFYNWTDKKSSFIILLSNSQNIQELIAESITALMIRAERLNAFDQLAISEEFRECLNEAIRL